MSCLYLRVRIVPVKPHVSSQQGLLGMPQKFYKEGESVCRAEMGHEDVQRGRNLQRYSLCVWLVLNAPTDALSCSSVRNLFKVYTGLFLLMPVYLNLIVHRTIAIDIKNSLVLVLSSGISNWRIHSFVYLFIHSMSICWMSLSIGHCFEHWRCISNKKKGLCTHDTYILTQKTYSEVWRNEVSCLRPPR
jgi:hypothetical protein